MISVCMQSETWAAMETLVDVGMAKHIGMCNVMVSSSSCIKGINS